MQKNVIISLDMFLGVGYPVPVLDGFGSFFRRLPPADLPGEPAEAETTQGHEESGMAPKLLAVLSPERQAGLSKVIDGQGLVTEYALGFQDGVRKLSADKSYDLLLVDADLADGSWRNLMLFVQNSGMSCEMIICSKLENQQLWAEVIQCGAYDLVAEPFDGQDLKRIFQSALESRYMQKFSKSSVGARPLAATA